MKAPLCETGADQYTVDRPSEACWRVLCSNPRPGASARSLLGPTGHIERMNALSHLLGAVLFAAYAPLRAALAPASTASALVTAGAAATAATMAVSTLYHVYGTVPWMTPALRVMDHGSIVLSLALTIVCDVVIAAGDQVAWRAVADAPLAATAVLGFFVYRRASLPPDETFRAWGSCSLGLYRFEHSDGAWSPVRTASYVALSFGAFLVYPAAAARLSESGFVELLVGNAVGMGILVLGMLVDNSWRWPDVAYQSGELPPCHSRSCGCICTSHAIWHVAALLSVASSFVGRELALAA